MLGVYHVPGLILGARDLAVGKTDKIPLVGSLWTIGDLMLGLMRHRSGHSTTRAYLRLLCSENWVSIVCCPAVTRPCPGLIISVSGINKTHCLSLTSKQDCPQLSIHYCCREGKMALDTVYRLCSLPGQGDWMRGV